MKLPAPANGDSRDTRSCLAFIAALPLDDAARAQRMMIEFLAVQLLEPPSPQDCLQILELVRAPLADVQNQLSRLYASRPLPPSATEDEAFRCAVSAWQAMEKCYAQVARRGGEVPAVQARLALICQRCIQYAGLVLLEHYRARRVVASGLWRELHGYFATAEEWGLAADSVVEPVGDPPRTTTCAATYASFLLADLANPYGRSARELAWILSWVRRFGGKTGLAPSAATAAGRRVGVDLMGDQGLQPIDKLGDSPATRVFDTTPLAAELQRLLEGLKGGDSPLSLGLGDNCPATEAARLLVFLYRPWCLGAIPRRFERVGTSGELPACFGFAAIHFQISGAEFVQPEHVRVFSRAEMDTLWTFRDQLDPDRPLYQRISQLGYQTEPWDIVDASVNGYGLYRLLHDTGSHLEHGQLCAVRRGNGPTFLLGRVSWLMRRSDGSLRAGMHLFGGRPEAVCLRPMGPKVAAHEQYTRAFLLPAVAGLREPESVIVPKGWFCAERSVELFTDRQVPVRMLELLESGSDFERISYRAV
jgi:hypothetical protein